MESQIGYRSGSRFAGFDSNKLAAVCILIATGYVHSAKAASGSLSNHQVGGGAAQGRHGVPFIGAPSRGNRPVVVRPPPLAGHRDAHSNAASQAVAKRWIPKLQWLPSRETVIGVAKGSAWTAGSVIVLGTLAFALRHNPTQLQQALIGIGAVGVSATAVIAIKPLPSGDQRR